MWENGEMDENYQSKKAVGKNYGSIQSDNNPKISYNIQRKLSKRRQAQEQKSLVVQLFKELITSINQNFSQHLRIEEKVPSSKNQKVVRTNGKQKGKQRQQKVRQSKEVREVQTNKRDEQQLLVRQRVRQQIWTNYEQIMQYEIIQQQVQGIDNEMSH